MHFDSSWACMSVLLQSPLSSCYLLCVIGCIFYQDPFFLSWSVWLDGQLWKEPWCLPVSPLTLMVWYILWYSDVHASVCFQIQFAQLKLDSHLNSCQCGKLSHWWLKKWKLEFKSHGRTPEYFCKCSNTTLGFFLDDLKKKKVFVLLQGHNLTKKTPNYWKKSDSTRPLSPPPPHRHTILLMFVLIPSHPN